MQLIDQAKYVSTQPMQFSRLDLLNLKFIAILVEFGRSYIF